MQQDNLITFLEESFRKNCNITALSDYFTDERFTYYTMSKEIAKLHLLFDECGLKESDKVAVVGRNNPRWAIAYIAALTYGAIAVPIMQDLDSNDINHIINHSGTKLLFLSDTLWDIIETGRSPKLKAAFSLSDFKCLYEKDGNKLREFQRNILKHYNTHYPKGFLPENIKYEIPKLDKVAAICYTSGTTGFSKGVMITIGNLTYNIDFILDKKVFEHGSKVLSLLPLGHIYGMMLDMIAPLVSGAQIVLLGHIPSLKVLIKALQDTHPKIVCTVPYVVENIVQKEILSHLQSGAAKIASRIPGVNAILDPAARKMLMYLFGGEVTHVVMGGSPLNNEIEEFLYRIKFPFTVGYGMTECGPLISYSAPDDFIKGSCGHVVNCMEARIDSPDPQNIPGEILVRGGNVMAGYYKDKKGTSEAIDSEDWLHTGDIGTINSAGTLFMRGRMETRIETPSGEFIYPEDIESRLNVMNCVMESFVVKRNGKLIALVVPDYEQVDALGENITGIMEVMKENLEAINETFDENHHLKEIVLYPTEFDKTPKLSIKRYLYSK